MEICHKEQNESSNDLNLLHRRGTTKTNDSHSYIQAISLVQQSDKRTKDAEYIKQDLAFSPLFIRQSNSLK